MGMIINKVRILYAAVGFLLGVGAFYAAERVPLGGRSQRAAASASQKTFGIRCLDEEGQEMRNDDDLLEFRCIDRKAQIAQSGNPQAVRKLADAVFTFAGISDVPDGVLNEFEERVLRSEMRYRTGNKPGIPEENIVRAVNKLAQKLNAPDYARTYRSEVELLRGEFRSGMPHFISPEGRTMSPLESTYVLNRLIYQKVLNETFLLTPEEHAKLEREKVPFPAAAVEAGELRTVSIHPRVKEMLALAHKTGAMKITDLIEMAHQLLDDLGIER
jgi:hypothetical protein